MIRSIAFAGAALSLVFAAPATAAKLLDIVSPTATGLYPTGPVYFKVKRRNYAAGRPNRFVNAKAQIHRYSVAQKKWKYLVTVNYNLKTTPGGKDIWYIVSKPGRYRIFAGWIDPVFGVMVGPTTFHTGWRWRRRGKIMRKRYSKPKVGPPPVEKMTPKINPVQ